jgi:hypothetical protein
MKRITLIFICLIFIENCYSQTLKISNGISINSLKGKRIDLFPGKINSYSGMLGVEYLQREWFYLSSEVGYLKLGGKESETIGDTTSRDKQWWNYVQLNTSFRIRTSSRNMELYLGAGPYINLLVGSGAFNKEMYAGYTTQKYNWGCKTEAGINENINKFRIGLNCSYLLALSPVAKSPYTSMAARSLSIYLSVGYRLK